ncbi:gamma-glutamyl hydrolase isoform X2 [Physeter macrocephalus]|uniref:Gamma-glutamyl hydrolase n=1 Tax=Physeter macrocephalus TaxID=9755 RepID=A0A2Y9SZW7_PHYMC|nr:gamma-glutamyl hydrolase isoform X2 [Physeter catodon]|eukprot:XP_023982857.1 gamma-glutamyl hydrolase isoform X2 [Physeter catodon]
MASLSLLLSVLGLVLCGAASLELSAPPARTSKKPIIGILMQRCHSENMKILGKYYIAASYVKYLESAGARVVPIRLDLKDEEYEKLFKSINGILFPGGGVNLMKSGYAHVAKIFYKLAIQGFGNGDYFPTWGTCLGFEELTYLVSGESLLTLTDTVGIKMPLNFTRGPLQSRMFQNFPADLLLSLAVEPLTANFHKWSLSVKNFTMNEKLKAFFNILTTNTDGYIEFISTMEARKNNHHFESDVEEGKALIYQYRPVYTGNISSFQQSYIFD